MNEYINKSNLFFFFFPATVFLLVSWIPLGNEALKSSTVALFFPFICILLNDSWMATEILLKITYILVFSNATISKVFVA